MKSHLYFLKPVEVTVKSWDVDIETLPLTDSLDGVVKAVALFEGLTLEVLPVIEDHLWEGLTRGGTTEVLIEAEGLHNWKVSLDDHEWGTFTLLLVEGTATPLGENAVDTTADSHWSGDFAKVDWLDESWGSGVLASVENTTAGWDDLTTVTVRSIGVEVNFDNVEADATEWFFAENTELGSPLEGGKEVLLDFLKVFGGLGGIDEEVWTSRVWTEAPNTASLSLFPAEPGGEFLSTGLDIHTWGDLVVLDSVKEWLIDWASLAHKPVELVSGLGHADDGGELSDGFTEGNDWWRPLDWDASIVLFKILKADFKVEFTGTGDDVLTGFFVGDLDAWVGLGKPVETFDKLWKVGSLLWLDGDTHDWGDRELHSLDWASDVGGGDGTALDEVLIDTDEGDGVTAWAVLKVLDLTTHHEDSPLDVGDVEVILVAWDVVSAHDADPLAGSDGTREDTTEGVETAFVGGWNHLGDVEHEWAVWLAIPDSLSALVILWTSVEGLGTVLLGLDWGWKVEDDHFKKGLSSWEPPPVDSAQEFTAFHLHFVVVELDAELLEHFHELWPLVSHDSPGEGNDWLENELAEGPWKELALIVDRLVEELPGGWVVVPLAPKLWHELADLNTELGGVELGELGKGEAEAVETRAEADGTLGWGNGEVTHWAIWVGVGGDDNVDVIDVLGEGLVHLFWVSVEFEKAPVDLVDDDDWLDPLGKGLTENSLGLDANAFNAVDDDEGTIGNTKGSSNFGGEVNMSWGVDKVDKETVTVGSLVLWEVLLWHGVVKGHTSGLDSDATFLFIWAGIHITGTTGGFVGDDTGTSDKGVGKSGLTVIDVGDNGHVTDVVALVHDLAQLVNREVHHKKVN